MGNYAYAIANGRATNNESQDKFISHLNFKVFDCMEIMM